MKTIELDQFIRFQFLSSLGITSDKKDLYFVLSKADMDNNGYLQKIVSFNLEKREFKDITEWDKSASFMSLKDGVYFVKSDPDKKGISTFYIVEEEGNKEAFTLPIPVSSLKDFDDEYYVALAMTNRACPDYYALSEEDKETYDKKVKDDEDYIVFDEYPFVFNGAGVVNGNRNSLFLLNKNDHKLEKITPDSFDVASFDVIGDKIIFSANDFTTYKTKWDKVYSYDLKEGIRTIYEDKMAIRKVFDEKGKIYVNGTFAKDYGEMEAGKFYELKDGKMELRIDTEDSLYNSVGSDSRYGRNKNYFKDNETNYFVTCEEDHTIILKMEADKLTKAVDIKGFSVDDFVVADDTFYAIALKDQKLQELYCIKDGKVEQLSSFNEEVLNDYYVAKPEKLTVKKAVDIDGWVLKPFEFDENKKYPAILDIHGGPKTAYGEVYYHEMQYWASKGYFVMFCNPRGSDGKGNLFADLRHQFGGIDYQDIMAFVDLVLGTYPNIDPERLGVTGGSYGGYMTNWIIDQTDRFKCAATQRSISNWISEVGVSDYGIDFPIEQEFGDVRNCAGELWAMSPLKFVNNAKTPTLFIHSTEDYRCPVPEALQLYTALTCNGVETRMCLFKGENHELSRSGKPTHRIRRLKEITDWMDSHLNG
ncbi:MAG: S9 family peptidase [Erysipelotrichaceae bacterium]|nr:S9 family peptidase [Erysipelotrichaceae bacterium]